MGFSILARNCLCSLMICWLLLVPAGVPVLVSLLLSSSFPQERGSVPSWFAGSSWFRLGFRCLSPFFSLLSLLKKGVLFHHALLVPLGSGWGSGACLSSSLFFGSGDCLPSSLFFLSSGKGFCCIMICWFFLVPAGVPVLVSLLLSSLVPVLVSLLLSSFFPQERGSVASWFAGSSWFRLGFRCLSPFFSLLSFLRKGVLGFRCLSPSFSLLWFRCLSPFFSLLSFIRKGVLFHHDLLVPPGSGWGSGACLSSSLFFGSGACLPSSLFFLSSEKGFCLIMDFLVPLRSGGVLVLLLSSFVPVLVFLFLSSFFPQQRAAVPSWFAGSSWFRLGFRCLSPFFSLLSFLRKGVLSHHDLLVPLGSGWGSGACFSSSLFFGSGACLPSSLFFLSSGKGFCSIMICWFPLVLAGVPVLVSLLLSFFPQERGSVPSWFVGSSWFRLGFRCLSLSPFFSLLSFRRKGVLFHHDLLVPPCSGWGSGACGSGACLPYSLFFGSGACLPSSLFFLSSGQEICSIMICWFFLVPAGVPVLVSLLLSSLVPVLVSLLLSSFFPQDRGSVPSWFAGSSWFRLGSWCLSPSFSLLWFRCLSPFSLLSFLRTGVLFHYIIMICWFLLVLAGVPVLVSLILSSFVPVLVSLLLSSFFPQERDSVPSWFAGSS